MSKVVKFMSCVFCQLKERKNYLQTLPNVPWKAKSPSVENHWPMARKETARKQLMRKAIKLFSKNQTAAWNKFAENIALKMA